MSVNKLLTFVNHNHDRRKEDNSLLDKSDKSIVFIKLTKMSRQMCYDMQWLMQSEAFPPNLPRRVCRVFQFRLF